MLKNYFAIFLRNLKKNKVYSILNILGLSISLALVFLIVLYVRYETTYDTYHKKSRRIYRVLRIDENWDLITPATSYLLAPVLSKEYPEVEAVTRISGVSNIEIESNGVFNNVFLVCVDPDIFNIFTLEFISGSRKNALAEPYDIIISEKNVAKLFPDENPIGKTLSFRIYDEIIDFTVKGVLKNVPSNSTFKMSYLVNIEIAKKMFSYIFSRYADINYVEQWSFNFYQTYILLQDDCNVETFIGKMNDIPDRYHDDNMNVTYDLQPLRKIYLHSKDLENNFTIEGNLSEIYLFSGIAFLILFIACANFMILSTAQSMQRLKEIAMRKVAGADKKNLITQIMCESIFTVLLSCVVAICLTHLFRPTIEMYLHTNIEINYFSDYVYPLSLIIITLIVGVASGSYVAMRISHLNPLAIIQTRSIISSSKSAFRRILICLQMVIFIGLITSSLIIYKQIHYVKKYDLGFDKENIVILDLTNDDFSKYYETFINKLKKYPDILDVTGGFNMPPDENSAIVKVPLLDDPNQEIDIESNGITYNYFETLKIELKEGRFFSQEYAKDAENSIILNETAVKALHIDNPIGKSILNKEIIGVVKDFNYHSLYYEIKPMKFTICPLSSINYIAIRLSPFNIDKTIQYIKDKWNDLNQGEPVNYEFMERKYNQMYRDTKNFSTIITYCTIFSIFIACLGLIGLIMFITKRKTKEIGIRKVFGASSSQIFKHLSKEIIYLSIISTIITTPLVLYLMNKWLENFAYKTEISFWIFIIAGLAGFCLSLLTISFFSIKASLADPVDTMKYE